MRNDKERKAFAEDPFNWKVVAEYEGDYPGGVRISALQYGGEAWYKVEIMGEYNMYDYVDGKLKEVRGWQALRMFAPSADGDVFGDTVSITQIVNAIKEIDMGRR